MAFSQLLDEIEKGTGKYDTTKQYFINNSTNEDIIVKWAEKEPEARGSGTYFIKAGEMGGPYPQFLAYHIVKVLVNREMQKDNKMNLFLSAIHRKPYEDKFLREVVAGEESPLTKKIRDEERAKLLDEMKKEPISDGPITSSETRRKALGKKSHTDEEFAGAKK